jgi:O-antigen ligase
MKSRLWNQLTFYALLASGAYTILLWSPNTLGEHISAITKIIIYVFPWLMLCLAFSRHIITERAHRLEIFLIVSIIILGVINICLSDSPSKSLSPMRTFLLTGVLSLWVSMFLLTDQHWHRVFDWFCCGCLAIIIPVEIIVWLVREKAGSWGFQVFAGHAIGLGTIIILLSSGPLSLLAVKGYRTRLVGGLLIFASSVVIFFTHKRGTWVAVAAMLTVGLIMLARRRKYLIAAVLIIATLIFTVQGARLYARLDPNVPRYASILQRLELYNFALHIWETHPLMGMGLRPWTHVKYLTDYQQVNQNLTDFSQSVAKLQTLDNMVLTAFVELGSLMTLAYAALVILILARYVRALWSSPASSTTDWYRLLIMLGLAIHSMSYDSLFLPPVNWLFHVQLGLMAAYYASHRAAGSLCRQAQVGA